MNKKRPVLDLTNDDDDAPPRSAVPRKVIDITDDDEEQNAAERVFATPYVARDIVRWAGLSKLDARFIHPAMSRLERKDPAFKRETKLMLRDDKVRAVAEDAWDYIKIEYWDTETNHKIREEMLYGGPTLQDRTGMRMENLQVTIFKHINGTDVGTEVHDRAVSTYFTYPVGIDTVRRTDATRQNHTIEPSFWRRLAPASAFGEQARPLNLMGTFGPRDPRGQSLENPTPFVPRYGL